MVNISTIKECEDVLAEYVLNSSQKYSGAMTTERARELAEFVGSPHKKIRVVHVAGTSGKTSTCYFISALLHASGKKVGLSVSPHITSVAERAQVNGMPLPEEKFVGYFTDFSEQVRRSGLPVSYFEFLIVFALWVFEKENVDYAVLETGLGGLYDASNICTRQDKIAVITDIGLDHVEILGDTLPEIALQKIGIVWPGNDVFSYRQPKEVMDVFKQKVLEKDAALHIVEPVDVDASSVPSFQQRNWNLAYQAYRVLATRDNLSLISPEELTATRKTAVPARMEIHQNNSKTIIIDGAHNQQKMETFFASFQRQYPNTKPSILLALKEGKELSDVAPIVAKNAAEVIVTKFTKEQDMPRGAMEPELLVAALRKAGMKNLVVEPELSKALPKLLSGQNNTLLIIGSFFLAAEARDLL